MELTLYYAHDRAAMQKSPVARGCGGCLSTSFSTPHVCYETRGFHGRVYIMTTLSKKVCLLGDFAVGKTSLVRRFVYDRYDDKYISTIGVKVSRKTVTFLQNRQIINMTMMLWDLAGSEEFNQVRASYLKGAAGAVLVCDLTRAETLTSVKKYIENFSNNRAAKFVLAANKYDLPDQYELTPARVEDTATELGIPFCLTSAKTGQEVETLFSRLAQLLVT